MDPFVIAIIVIVAVLLLIVAPCIIAYLYTWPIAKHIYEDKLVKSEPDKWGRECSCPENEEHFRMWNIGLDWIKETAPDCRESEVTIENDGLKLYGEYFDFGSDTCVLVVPGRCETYLYSCYFAEGYRGVKVNFLLMDPRAHGKSEGKYSYCGIKEADDVLAWSKYAKNVLGNKKIILHGICIGAASCFMAKEKDEDGVISGIISEGCFTTFYESFRQHVICEKKPQQPIMMQLRRIFKKNLGIDIKAQSPMKAMKKINIPVLFFAGKMDLFSVPSETQKLVDACASADKKLVWYEKGAHSHLRINNTEDYDREVREFIQNGHF